MAFRYRFGNNNKRILVGKQMILRLVVTHKQGEFSLTPELDRFLRLGLEMII